MVNETTSIDPDKNVWWKTFVASCKDLEIELAPGYFPAATDSRYLRELNIPALGFTPLPNTPVLFHDHDEFVSLDSYAKAIDIYVHLIKSLVQLIES